VALELKLSSATEAKIYIYNIKGQLIRKMETIPLVQVYNFCLGWLDNKNRAVPSGIYLIIVKSEQRTDIIHKLLKCN
jgi:hypothetical protein